MIDKKFDFACIYYTNELIVQLEGEDFFSTTMVLPEKLRYIILMLVQNNYTAIGKLGLSEEQMIKAIEHAQKESYEATVNDMVKEGLISYTGMNEKGDYVAELTEAGKVADGKNQAMIKTALEIRRLYNNEPNAESPAV
jgi:hypothetical protein